MSDLKMDPFGDIDITDQKLSLVTGPDAVAQQLKIRLRFFRGEWFLDQRLGIPFYRDIFINNPNLHTVAGIYRRAVSETPGVESVQRLDVNFDGRTLTVDFSAKLEGEDTARDFSEVFIL